MRYRLVLVAVTMLILSSVSLSAEGPLGGPADDAFWVDYWAKPRVVLYGLEEEAFNQNVHKITFAHDGFDHALDQDTLSADIHWLKDNATARFFIEGYASSTGDYAYNLNLSLRRAEWIKQVLIRKGIAENRIKLAVPWGKSYPACTEDTDECHAKNRVVRLVYSPN
jgi:outer membrane protein OmpA-like peptidoglycan-associated protein